VFVNERGQDRHFLFGQVLASKAKVTAAVTVKGVEMLMTTTRTSAKEAR
jgi:hypothetical protein